MTAELARLTEALVAGGPLATIVAAVKERETRAARLRANLAALDAMASVTRLDVRRLRDDLSVRLDEWRGLLRREPVQARQILRKLVSGRLIFTPGEDGAGRFYEFTGDGAPPGGRRPCYGECDPGGFRRTLVVCHPDRRGGMRRRDHGSLGGHGM